jgi:two-component system chemotaxis response regulator CheB
MRLEAGTVIIAPGDLHMVIKPVMGSSDNFRIEFSENEGDLFDRPSIDMLMSSVAKAYGDKAIGVILSGMGSDGAQGVRKMSQYGGLTVVQDQQSALIFGMGKAACETGCVNTVLPLSEINSYIRSRVTSDSLKSVEV